MAERDLDLTPISKEEADELIPISKEEATGLIGYLSPKDFEPMSSGEIFGKGMQSGGSIGTSDEIAGMAAAAGYASGSYKMPSLEELLGVYREGRDEERRKLDQARQQSQGEMFLGEMVGGSFLPIPGVGGLAKAGGEGALKGTKAIAQATKEGLKTGGIVGGVAGLTTSKADLTKVAEQPQVLGELGQDIALGTTTGAATGGVINAGLKTGKTVAKAGWDVVKETGKHLLEMSYPERLIKANVETFKGNKILGKEAGQALSGELFTNSENFVNDLITIDKGLRSKYEGLFKKLENNKTNVEGIFKESIDDLNKVIDNPNIPENIKKEATALRDDFLTKIYGEETQYATELIKKPAVDPATKAREELLAQRAKLSASKDMPGKVAEQKVKEKAAEQIQLAKNRQQAAAKEAAAGEDFGDYVPGAVSNEFPIPNFAKPETLIDETTGKSVVQMIDEQSGQTVLKAFDEFKPANITEDVDLATGLKVLRMVDENTGKVYTKVLKPQQEKLYTETKPIVGRVSAKKEWSPAEIHKEKSQLGDMIYQQDGFQSRDVKQIAEKTRDKLTKTLPEIDPQIKALDQEKQVLVQSVKNLGVDLERETSLKDASKIMNLFEKADADRVFDYRKLILLEKTLDQLDTKFPGIKNKYLPKINDLAEKLRINQETQTGFLARGIQMSTVGAKAAGETYRKITGAASDIGKTLQDATPETIQNLVSLSLSSGMKGSKILASELMELAKRDTPGRQKLIFALMQNPQYREILNSIQPNNQEMNSGSKPTE